jgi:hypothetical protein
MHQSLFKADATARGLQLPKCSINQRGQQPITDEQAPDGYVKPIESGLTSQKVA